MYSAHSTSYLGVIDGSGTINPAAFNSSGMLPNSSGTITPDTSPRGTKRGYSSQDHTNFPTTDDLGQNTELRREKKVCQITEAVVGNLKPRKRGRPSKTRLSVAGLESPYQQPTIISQNIPPTPQSQIATLPHQISTNASIRVSPHSTTPTKATTIKSLPTARDHTTDQVGAEGDEYIPKEYDEAGEKKVDINGQLSGGREYKCRTFFVPNHGEKLFMLATECARVLGYRDSYLLFNKNRSLFKIIASQAEKEDLIRQEMLPYSYRSRQIAIVSARSMFRQFGSRVIRNGRRVRDDYWESKARKQGFTEEDLAGEKRPGAARARDAAAATQLATTSLLAPRHDILYSNDPGNFTIDAQAHTLQAGMTGELGGGPSHPLVSLAPEQSDIRIRDYSNIRRPRQEIIGSPYHDRIPPTSPVDVISQAHQAAEYSKQINQQRHRNFEFLHRRWRQPHSLPSLSISPRPIAPGEEPCLNQPLHSLRVLQSGGQTPSSAPQTAQHLTSSQQFSQVSQSQANVVHPPIRSANVASMSSGQSGAAPGMFIGINNPPGSSSYGYNQQAQTWTPQVQQPPQSFNFSAKSPPNQRSPHLRQTGNNSQLHQVAQYSNTQGFGQGYPNLGTGLYTPDRGPPNYMQLNTSEPQTNTQIWTGQPPSASGTNWSWGGST